MPRLTDYNPQWVYHDGRRGLGLIMTAPAYPKWRLLVLFANPLDGGPTWVGTDRPLLIALVPDPDRRQFVCGSGSNRWTRTGETFDTLTLSPSVDAGERLGHFTVTAGGW